MAERVSKTKKETAQESKVGVPARYYSLLLAPVITEKASMLSSDRRRAVFKVAKDATKLDIRQAVERVFGVQVQSVRTCNMLGKLKRSQRSVGRRPGFKKAYVTLKPGQSIDIVEGV